MCTAHIILKVYEISPRPPWAGDKPVLVPSTEHFSFSLRSTLLFRHPKSSAFSPVQHKSKLVGWSVFLFVCLFCFVLLILFLFCLFLLFCCFFLVFFCLFVLFVCLFGFCFVYCFLFVFLFCFFLFFFFGGGGGAILGKNE